jgi:hypothetical protein
MPDGMTVQIRGLDKLLSQSKLAQEVVMQSLAASVYREGELIMGRSKDEFVNVDTGALKSTGHVEEPTTSGGVVNVEMGYGGPSGVLTADGQDYVGYALYVHEGTERMEGSFYLERPAMEESSAMPERVRHDVAVALDEKFDR